MLFLSNFNSTWDQYIDAFTDTKRDCSCDHRRQQSPLDDVAVLLDIARTVRKHETSLTLRQASFHSRNSRTTFGGNGIVRSPAADLGDPMRLRRSAR